jgi:putative peptidoglycan lipid II flippase
MKEKIIKHSVFVLVLIVLGKLLSFLRDVAISSIYGSGTETDAYFAANSIPSILFVAILSSYVALLIPTYKRMELTADRQKANLFVSRLINFFLIITVLFSGLGYFFFDKLIQIVAPGFDTYTYDLSVRLGKILVLSFPFSAMTLILANISNANNKYYATHIIPIFSALFVIICVLLFAEKYGIFVLAISGVLAFVFQMLIQFLISKKHFKYTFTTKIWDNDIKVMTWLAFPIFLGFSIDQINLLANTIIASHLSDGSLSSLNYAQRLQSTITGLFSTALLTVIYPLISKLNVENRQDKIREVTSKSLRGIFLILVPIIVFLAFNSKSLVSIVFYRGKFDLNALSQTSSIFLFYALNVMFISVREIILRIFYVKNQTKIPFWTSAVSLSINVILSIILVIYLKFGVAGLSLSNLIATAIGSVILFSLISKKTNIAIDWKNVIHFSIPLIIPICALVLLQYIQFKFIDIGNNIFLFLLCFILSATLFFIFLLFGKQKDAVLLADIIKNKVKNKF